MPLSLVRTLAPAVEPLTIAEVRSHLRIDATADEPVPGAPTATLVNPVAAGNVDNGAHRYCVTFVTADGETNGGAISGVVTVADKTVCGKVTVSGVPLGGALVTARKIYRTKSALDVFYLVATLADNTTQTFLDNVADASLGVGVPVTNTTGDPQLSRLIQVARENAEDDLHRALITQTWRLTLDGFPNGTCNDDVIPLPRPNLLAVTAFTYIDLGGAQQSVDPTLYTVDTDSLPGRIVLNYVKIWPIARAQRGSVQVTFQCGYGPAAANVPVAIRHAMLLDIGDLYANREATGETSLIMPLAARDNLLGPHIYRGVYA